MRTQRLITDRYSLVEPLPGSATGERWHAQDLWSGQHVMITRVPVSQLAGAEQLRARRALVTEVRVLSALRHDRLARPLDLVIEDADLWVVAEPLVGVKMADELARRGPIGPEEAGRWGRDMADGLAAAHAAGVPHRNLHAEMVSLTANGRAVVGGFATSMGSPDGRLGGTPGCLAPEVARGEPPSPAADVFALGAMLSVALQRRVPLPADTDRDQWLAAVAASDVAATQRLGPMSEPLRRMLHHDPTQRLTAAAVADQLGQLTAAPDARAWTTSRTDPPPADIPAARKPVPAEPPSNDGQLPWVAPPRRPNILGRSTTWGKHAWWMVAAAVVAVLALTGGLVVAFWPPAKSGGAGRPAATWAPPPIGDPRTADPCGLLTEDSARQFGRPTMIRDLGYPQTCTIEIETGGTGFVYLRAAFGAAEDQPPAGVPGRFGMFTISREAANNGICGRTVVLDDQSRVYVVAQAFQGVTTDVCAVADAGTQTAVSALSSGSLPRRDITGSPHALTGLDTCSLLDPAVLAQVPGLDSARRDRGFAG